MGRRMAVLRQIGAKGAGRVLLVSPEALVQRLPPAEVVAAAVFDLAPGQAVNREALSAFARRAGYVFDDRIDEPGEIALLGEVIDIFPANAALPVRIAL